MKPNLLLQIGLLSTALFAIPTAFPADVTGDRLNIGSGHTLSGTDASIAGGFTNKVTAGYSTIAGGYGNVISNQYSFIGGGDANLITSDSSVIAGGEVNTTGGYESAIGGGALNTITSAGSQSVIGGGYQNSVSSTYDAIAGGYNNSVSGQTAFIGGGYINTNTATSGTIGGGTENLVSGSYATIAGGASATATLYGQSAHANGAFSTLGDAQTSEYVLRNTTTTTNTTELFLDGSSQRMSLPSNGTWTYDILVAVRGTNGVSGGYHTNGVIKLVSGTTTLVGVGSSSLTVPAIASDISSWSVTVNADTNNALVVKVKGHASTNRWVATVRTTEVKN